MPYKLFLYARKSQERVDRQIQSIDNQIELMTKLAKDRGYKIIEVFQESRSAKAPGRPVFNKMMDRLLKGEADGIIAWKLDRLARNPVDSGQIQYGLQINKINVIITPEKEYHQEHAGILMSVESGMATQFIIDLSKAVHRGLDYKLEKGEFTGYAPEGYINKNHKILPDPERFDMVRKIWDMMLTGNYSATKIADIANNDWGYRTKRGTKLKYSSIYGILNNIFYTGDMKVKNNIYKGTHKSMIKWEEYNVVQKILGSKGKAKLVKHEYPYTGIIRCGNCSSMITAGNKLKYIKSKQENKLYFYYWCTRKNKSIDHDCKQRAISTNLLEEQIKNYLDSICIKEDFYNWAIKSINEKLDINKDENESIIRNLERQEKSLIDSIDKIEDMLIAGKITEEKYDIKIEVLRNDLKEIQEKLNNKGSIENDKYRTFKSVLDFSKYAKEVFEDGGFQTKKELLKSLGLHHTLKDSVLTIELYPWFSILEKYKKGLNTKNNEFAPIKNGISFGETNTINTENLSWQGLLKSIITSVMKYEGYINTPKL